MSAVCVRAIGMFLRLADSAVLRMRNINMVCPDCYERVPYPGYECPGRGCGHHQLRELALGDPALPGGRQG